MNRFQHKFVRIALLAFTFSLLSIFYKHMNVNAQTLPSLSFISVHQDTTTFYNRTETEKITDNRRTEIRFVEGSRLRINGRSNVTQFTCESEHDITKVDLSVETAVTLQSISVSGARLELEVELFDCGRAPINRDFRTTLKSDQYPVMLLQLEEVIFDSTDSKPEKAQFIIHIAGVDRKEIVDLDVADLKSSVIEVKGVKRLKITDFGLTPPTAMFGLIKVEDELDIVFDLKLERRE